MLSLSSTLQSTIPHVYASVDCLMDNMLALRRKLKGTRLFCCLRVVWQLLFIVVCCCLFAADHRLVVSINDLVLKAAAVALRVSCIDVVWTVAGHVCVCLCEQV